MKYIFISIFETEKITWSLNLLIPKWHTYWRTTNGMKVVGKIFRGGPAVYLSAIGTKMNNVGGQSSAVLDRL